MRRVVNQFRAVTEPSRILCVGSATLDISKGIRAIDGHHAGGDGFDVQPLSYVGEFDAVPAADCTQVGSGVLGGTGNPRHPLACLCNGVGLHDAARAFDVWYQFNTTSGQAVFALEPLDFAGEALYLGRLRDLGHQHDVRPRRNDGSKIVQPVGL